MKPSRIQKAVNRVIEEGRNLQDECEPFVDVMQGLVAALEEEGQLSNNVTAELRTLQQLVSDVTGDIRSLNNDFIMELRYALGEYESTDEESEPQEKEKRYNLRMKQLKEALKPKQKAIKRKATKGSMIKSSKKQKKDEGPPPPPTGGAPLPVQ